MGGEVFGMQQTAVNPPLAAASVPVAIVSFSSKPGSRRWQCRSMNPGETTMPLAERIRQPSGHILSPFSPTHSKWPSRHVNAFGGVNNASTGDKQESTLHSLSPTAEPTDNQLTLAPSYTCCCAIRCAGPVRIKLTLNIESPSTLRILPRHESSRLCFAL